MKTIIVKNPSERLLTEIKKNQDIYSDLSKGVSCKKIEKKYNIKFVTPI
jgi:hypothetical protein